MSNLNIAWRDLQERWASTDGPPWKLFPWLLILAYAIRLAVALTSDYLWRPDELASYLEQTHRIVFGYGFIPWDIDLKVRSWLVAGLPIAVLQSFSWLGLDHPDYYVPAVRVINATVALAIPVGTYVLCRRTLGENTARVAFVISCFWYEFIVMAPHTLAEFYATSLFFAASALIKRCPSPTRVALIGLLLGLAIALRPHYALAISLFGLILLFLLRSFATRCSYLAGGLVAFVAWGLIDRLTLGGWWVSSYNYLIEVTTLFEHSPYTAPSIVVRLSRLFVPSLGLLYVAVIWGIFICWKRLFVISLPLLGVLLFHFLIHVGPEYSNYRLAVALAAICVADFALVVVARSTTFAAVKQYTSIFAFAILSGLSLQGSLPGLKYTELAHNSYFNHITGVYGAYRQLSRLPREAVQGVFFDSWSSGGTTGAYYYLHHRVPLIQPGTTYEGIIELKGYDAILEIYASHVVTNDPSCFVDYKEIGKSGVWFVLERQRELEFSMQDASQDMLELDLTPAPIHRTLKANQLTYYSWRNNCRNT